MPAAEPGVRFRNGILKGDPAARRPGGCTRDLVHKFYQEQYQLDGGQQDRYVTGSDAVGLTMGYYDTKQLPIYEYLHANGAPNYVIADHFFQGAFGGSYLNHQYLIAAQPPPWPTPRRPASTRCSTRDGIPATPYPLYKPTAPSSTVPSPRPAARRRPSPAWPAATGRSTRSSRPGSRRAASARPRCRVDRRHDRPDLNIGDRMSDAGVSWAWYAGGWDNAAGNVGGPRLDQRPRPSRHLHGPARLDAPTGQLPVLPGLVVPVPPPAVQLLRALRAGHARAGRAPEGRGRRSSPRPRTARCRQVSFVKPIGNENEHPGYASEPQRQRPPRRPDQGDRDGPEARTR